MRWGLGATFFLCGLCTLDTSAWGWALLGSVLFLLPLLLQLCRWPAVRYGALWLGVFLTAQTLVSVLRAGDYITLPPHFRQRIDVKGGFPGIQGPQTITTDQQGFRVTRPINYAEKTRYRIFAIGGSTTADIYLDDHKTWTYLLQERLSRFYHNEVEVINTGVSGLRMRHHVATLKRIVPYKPDMVLFLVGVNDWNWHIRDTFGGNFERHRRKFFLSTTMLGKVLSALFWQFGPNVSGVTVEYGESLAKKRGSLNRKKQYHFTPTSVDQQYVNMLQQASNICRKFSIECYFVTQPTGYQPEASEEFRAGFWATPSEDDYTLDFDSLVHIAALYNSYLTEFATLNKQKYCDLAAKIAPSYENFYDDCHFNEQGAAVVAEALFSCIAASRHALLPRSGP
jgi:lysophospholipase L1-like esterase